MKRTYKIALIVVAAIIIIGAADLYLNAYAASLENSLNRNLTGTGPVTLSGQLSQSRVFEYNDSQQFMSYSLVSYSATGASQASVSLDVYAKDPVERIYLLNVSRFCVSCFDEDALRSELASDLQSYDLIKNGSSFVYVSIANISRIAPNSIVIVPSGLMPIALMNDSGAELLGLLKEGDTIVYVGQNFSKSIGPNGLIFVTPEETLVNLQQAHLDTYFISHVTPPGAPANMSFSKQTFIFGSAERYGNVSYVNSESGSVVAFTNYPKSSWSSPKSMASDLASAIDARFWMLRLGHYTGGINVTSKPSGAIGAFASTLSKANLTTLGVEINSTYSLVSLSARNSNNTARVELGVRDSFRENGSMGIPASIGETQNIPLLINVNGNNPKALYHLELSDSNMSYVSGIPIGFITDTFGVVKYYAFSIPSGYYAVSIKDFNETTFATAFFYLENATIVPTNLDFKNGVFNFSIFSDGFPVNNATYVANLNGGYSAGGFVANGKLTYSLPKGTVVGYGNESFNLRMFNTDYVYSTTYMQRVFNIPAIYLEFAVAIIVVVLLNLVLKPPNRDEYYIDVPEFPPSKKDQVKVQASDIVSVFDKVNYYYHWKYMPLTAEEVRSGIGNNIRINSRPIAITTQNTNTIIFNLMGEGKLENASNYYAPSVWVETSGHSVEYLTVFRKIRDYCVSHAMLFTDLDAIENADMAITKNSKQIDVLIYTTHAKMKRITLSKDSRTAIVFLNEDVMRDFFDKLYSSFGEDVEILKMGIEYNYIKTIDANNLDQLSL